MSIRLHGPFRGSQNVRQELLDVHRADPAVIPVKGRRSHESGLELQGVEVLLRLQEVEALMHTLDQAISLPCG